MYGVYRNIISVTVIHEVLFNLLGDTSSLNADTVLPSEKYCVGLIGPNIKILGDLKPTGLALESNSIKKFLTFYSASFICIIDKRFIIFL